MLLVTGEDVGPAMVDELPALRNQPLDGYIPLVYTFGVTTAKIFPNGRSQAVRLPKEFRFEEDEVFITRMGTAVVLLPKVGGWNVLFEAIDGFSDDFMADRAQPSEHQERDLDL